MQGAWAYHNCQHFCKISANLAKMRVFAGATPPPTGPSVSPARPTAQGPGYAHPAISHPAASPAGNSSQDR